MKYRLIVAASLLLLPFGPALRRPALEEPTCAAFRHIERDQRLATLQERDDRGLSFDEPRWHLVNLRANLRVYADPRGLEFRARVNHSGPPWKVRLEAEGLAAGKVGNGEEAVLIRRDRVEERVDNRPDGLEHSFRIHEGPAGPFSLRLKASLSGGLSVRETGGDGVVFDQDGREAMAYRGLKVIDARGRTLGSRMTWEDGAIALHVMEAGEYPILIDPLATDPSWQALGAFHANQVGASFGYAVAIVPSLNGDAIDDLVVGAPGFDSGQGDEGKIFVFRGHEFFGIDILGGSQAPWTTAGPFPGMRFGHSVASAGNVDGDAYHDLIVGAPGFSSVDHPQAGAFMVIPGSASGPDITRNAFHSGSHAGDNLGWSVAGVGDVNDGGSGDVLVGAPGYGEGLAGQGAAFVYYGEGPGTLAGLPGWSDVGSITDARFGASVAAAGEINTDPYPDFVVGAPGANIANVYHGSATGPSGEAVRTLTGTGAFGHCVTCGDFDANGLADIAVGAPDAAGRGRVSVYYSSPIEGVTTWTTLGLVLAGRFGSSLAAGDVNDDGADELIVGAPDWSNGLEFQGAVFVFQSRPGTGLIRVGTEGSFLPTHTLPGPEAGARFGSTVAAGDIHGDGYSDVAVGAPDHDGGIPNSGRTALYYGFNGVPILPADLVQGRPEGAAEVPEGGTLFDTGFSVSATVSDPDGHPVSLQVQIRASGSPFDGTEPLFTSATAGSGERIRIAIPPQGIGDFGWRARALDHRQDGSVRAGSDWIEFGATADNQGADIRFRGNSAPVASGPRQQRAADGRDIGVGDLLRDEHSVRLGVDVQDDDGDAARLEVEIKPLGSGFTGSPSAAGEMVPDGSPTFVTVALEEGRYRWRYRLTDEFGLAGPWTSFGANGEGEADFEIAPIGSLGRKKVCGASAAAEMGVLDLAFLMAATSLLKLQKRRGKTG